jgi:hypothetical protein
MHPDNREVQKAVHHAMMSTLQKAPHVKVLLTICGLCFSCNPSCDDAPAACELLPDPGPCFAAIPKFYFDSAAQECKEFTWGGCGGVVPFDTFVACQECQCD